MKAIIFDFDGTIADSFDVFVETLKEIVKLPTPLTNKDVEQLRGLTTRGVMKKLHIQWWQLPRLIVVGRRKMAEKIDRVQIFPGISDALRKLADKNYSLYIISSNDTAAIQSFLKENGLADYFSSVDAAVGINGKSKYIKKLVKRNKLSPSACVYIGDEVRDVHAAQKASIKSVAVTWGYSTLNALEQAKPDALADTPKSLPRVINSILE